MSKFYITKESFPPYNTKLWCYGKPKKLPNGAWGAEQYNEDFPCIVLESGLFPEVTADNSPMEIEIKIKENK